MNQIERNVLPAVGPRFFRANDGTVMFEFTVDPNNVIGPRPASPKDRSKHAETYRAFSSADMTEAMVKDERRDLTATPPSEVVYQKYDGYHALNIAPADDAQPPQPVSETPDIEQVAADVFNGADPAAFDHDGDGKAGGSLPKPETATQVPPRSPKRSYTRRAK